jgi:hypothetical protein
MAGIDIETMTNALPDSFKEKGIDKMRTIIFEQGLKIKNELQPQLDKLNNLIPTDKKVCLTEPQTNRILFVRNNLIGQLNNIQSILDLTSLSVTSTAKFLEVLIILASTLKNTRTAVVAASSVSPVIPGAVVSTIQTISEIVDKITFDNLGNSRLNPIKTSLDAAAIPIAVTASLIAIFINKLNNIDQYLKRCTSNITLDPIDQNLILTTEFQNQINNQSASNSNFTSYQGFNIEIEEKIFETGIKQIRAVGKDAQGIVLISTPYSFTTDTQILIDQLKLIIDRDNLKAN